MIGSFWSTGIVLKEHLGQWMAEAEFLDAGFCQSDSTEGHIHLRYWVPDLAQGIDTLKGDVERMGIAWREPWLCYDQDGRDTAYPPPDNYVAILQEQAERIGWRTYGSLGE